jgi:hypothetical protein
MYIMISNYRMELERLRGWSFCGERGVEKYSSSLLLPEINSRKCDKCEVGSNNPSFWIFIQGLGESLFMTLKHSKLGYSSDGISTFIFMAKQTHLYFSPLQIQCWKVQNYSALCDILISYIVVKRSGAYQVIILTVLLRRHLFNDEYLCIISMYPVRSLKVDLTCSLYLPFDPIWREIFIQRHGRLRQLHITTSACLATFATSGDSHTQYTM